MNINDYKESLKKMIDATDDEAILKRWNDQLESELEQHRQQQSDQSQQASTGGSTSDNAGKDDTTGYVVLESGLGIDE